MKIQKGMKRSALIASMLLGSVAISPLATAEEVSQMRDVDSFTEIVVAGAMDLTVQVGDSQSVEVIVDEGRRARGEGYMDRVETTVSNGVLRIRQKGRRWNDVDVEVRITVPSLAGLTVEGAADANIKGLNAAEFEVNIEGAADLYMEGTCGSLDIEINGAGDIDSKDLQCENVEVEINGAGDAEVYASVSIEAELNGIGDVTVYGNPTTVRPRIHGLGSFELK